MKFALESFSWELINEMYPLFKAHNVEVPNLKSVEFSPNFELYEQCAKTNSLRIFTVRQGHALYGYQIFVVGPHLHARHSMQANQDILYIDPKARKGLLGYRFIKWCAEQLMIEGISVIHQHISAKNNFGKILERIGFHLEDLTYSLEVA